MSNIEWTTNEFVLQLHITDKCLNNCRHCYLDSKNKRSMSKDQVLGIIEQFRRLLDQYEDVSEGKCDGILQVTGGDPLLELDLLHFILDECNRYKIKVAILGNPDFLTAPILHDLIGRNLRSYQISVDGTRSVHDQFRGKEGSFDNSLNALSLLRENDAKSFVMFNLHKENMSEIIEVYDEVSQAGAAYFVFARVVSIGEAKKNNLDVDISPNEYRELLKNIEKHAEESGGAKLVYKCPLWTLYKHETGELQNQEEVIFGGCGAGINTLSIDVNGDVMPCRRVQDVVGNVFEGDIADMFFGEKLDKYRFPEHAGDCGDCELFNCCRGCKALGNTDPQCWKNKS